MFRPRNTVMPPKKSTFHSLKAHETLKCSKNSKTLKEFSSGLSIDARILEFLDFFEHYSVSCAPCPKNHESVDPGGGGAS